MFSGLARRISGAMRRQVGLAVSTPVAEAFLSWEELRDRESALAVAATPADYKRYHQAQASRWLPFEGKRVLVIGCNRGEDCEYFVNLGAASVVGLDVMDEIGINFQHASVRYVKASAEKAPLDSASFDLVFAYATLEHVPDIRRAFAEMARLAAVGGIIYSAAAPLWCTRAGPHWGDAFDHDPWPHLRMTADEVVALAARAQASGLKSEYYDPERLIYYLTDPLLFNRRRANEYLDACVTLDGIEILRNEIQMEAQVSYDSAVARSLIEHGYTTFDLFGLTHLFIARRR